MPSLLALASVWRHRCKIEEHMPRLVHAGPMGKEVLFRRQLPRMEPPPPARLGGAAIIGDRRSNPPGTARERVCATVGRQATDAHQPHIFPSASPLHTCAVCSFRWPKFREILFHRNPPTLVGRFPKLATVGTRPRNQLGVEDRASNNRFLWR
jgi:hypothetical protein